MVTPLHSSPAVRAQPTIASLATPSGVGALALIRVSGAEALTTVQQLFRGKTLLDHPRQRVFYGSLVRGAEVIDEVVLTVSRQPHSFTREDTVEIACHNSVYVVQATLEALLDAGALAARPGEFTQRAFLNGRFDLAQAEAVADLIAADSRVAHRTALNQLRGGFSEKINALRQQLIDFAALLELELDFGEEDVTFANRDSLQMLILTIDKSISPLIESFTFGNSLKDGVPLVIAGRPNAGKSSLLNALLGDDRAIVSDRPGTTRDSIEDTLTLDGIKFRLTDTAGLRVTEDEIEAQGVQRTQSLMRRASLILYLFDAPATQPDNLSAELFPLLELGVPYLLVGNKTDLLTDDHRAALELAHPGIAWVSATDGRGLEQLKEATVARVRGDGTAQSDVIVTNVRHYQHLRATQIALAAAADKIRQDVTADWVALDVRQALTQLGAITGSIVNDDVLASIFSRFCIGK